MLYPARIVQTDVVNAHRLLRCHAHTLQEGVSIYQYHDSATRGDDCETRIAIVNRDILPQQPHVGRLTS